MGIREGRTGVIVKEDGGRSNSDYNGERKKNPRFRGKS